MLSKALCSHTDGETHGEQRPLFNGVEFHHLTDESLQSRPASRFLCLTLKTKTKL